MKEMYFHNFQGFKNSIVAIMKKICWNICSWIATYIKSMFSKRMKNEENLSIRGPKAQLLWRGEIYLLSWNSQIAHKLHFSLLFVNKSFLIVFVP